MGGLNTADLTLRRKNCWAVLRMVMNFRVLMHNKWKLFDGLKTCYNVRQGFPRSVFLY